MPILHQRHLQMTKWVGAVRILKFLGAFDAQHHKTKPCPTPAYGGGLSYLILKICVGVLNDIYDE